MNLYIKKITEKIPAEHWRVTFGVLAAIFAFTESLNSWSYILEKDLKTEVNIVVWLLALLALLFFLRKLINDNSSNDVNPLEGSRRIEIDRKNYRNYLIKKITSINKSERNSQLDKDIIKFNKFFKGILKNPGDPGDDPSSEIILDILHTLSKEGINESKSLDALINITHHDKNDIIESVKLLKDKGFIINQIIIDKVGKTKQLDPEEWKLKHPELNEDIHAYTDRYVSLVQKDKDIIFKKFFNKILKNPGDNPSSEIILDILHTLSTLSKEGINESKSLDALINITNHDRDDILESIATLKSKGFIDISDPKAKEWKLKHPELNEDIHAYTDRYVSLERKDNIRYFIDLDSNHDKGLEGVTTKWQAILFWLVILVCAYRLINPTAHWDAEFDPNNINVDFDYWYILVCHGYWAYYVTRFYKNYFHKAAKIYGNPLSFKIANHLMIWIVFVPMLYTAFFDRSFWMWTVVIGGMGVALNLFFFRSKYLKGAEFKKRIWDQAQESMVNMSLVAFVAFSMGTMITPALNFYEFSAKFLTDDNRKQIISSLGQIEEIEEETNKSVNDADKSSTIYGKNRDEYLKKLFEKLQERDRVNNIEAITEALKAALIINITEERKNLVDKKLVNDVNDIGINVGEPLTKELIESLSDEEFLIATGLEDTQVKKLQDVLIDLSDKINNDNMTAFNNKPTYYLESGKKLDLWLAVLLSIFAYFAINWHTNRQIVSARLGTTRKDFLKK
jgi:hypothetical protein